MLLNYAPVPVQWKQRETHINEYAGFTEFGAIWARTGKHQSPKFNIGFKGEVHFAEIHAACKLYWNSIPNFQAWQIDASDKISNVEVTVSIRPSVSVIAVCEYISRLFYKPTQRRPIIRILSELTRDLISKHATAIQAHHALWSKDNRYRRMEGNALSKMDV